MSMNKVKHNKKHLTNVYHETMLSEIKETHNLNITWFHVYHKRNIIGVDAKNNYILPLSIVKNHKGK